MWCLAKLHGMWYLHDGSCLLWYNSKLNKKRDLWLALKCVPMIPCVTKGRSSEEEAFIPVVWREANFSITARGTGETCVPENSDRDHPKAPNSIRSANTKY
ncbi:hypothetical protein CDAR_600651 [Caerostris darwini]|uniref:Uncharacterized protein n=1 Tax=Caerostris darwini TaxID=1538125 RepID=A0AAV4TRZ4_9ARAC|nr:hypothetical protein CDAR_600651 [Caerostris darwini]